MKNINQAVSVQVLALVASGSDPVDALRAVCGAETVDTMIDELYHELRVREGAASHLRGIVALQNQSSIDHLYDRLSELHIQRMESVN